MMNSRVPICLITLAFFFFGGANGAKITFNNKCAYTVWPVPYANTPNPQLPKTGFELASGDSNSVDVPAPWSGKFWARTGCSNKGGEFTCETADCRSGEVPCKGGAATPPATTAGLQVGANGQPDFYNIDISNGFNVPMSIVPQGGNGDCKPSSCGANVNSACPGKLQRKGSDGTVVACKSACLAFNDAKNCCTGEFSGEKCPPPQYSDFFEKQCPQAYSYPNDDKGGTFTCSAGPSYTLTLCP